MNAITNCPDSRLWLSLLNRQLPDDEVSSLHQHLQDCPACLETVRSIAPDDTLLRSVIGSAEDVDARLQKLRETMAASRAAQPATGQATPLPDAANVASLMIAPPELLGRYRILERLGAGGMGTVFKAHDPSLNRIVAIKLPHFDPDKPERIERFLREARAAARVRHPNICPIFDVGQAAPIPYAVMAYIDGKPLDAVLRETRPTDAQAVTWACKIVRGLAAVHQEGVIHRDLKPGNILIDPAGEPLLTDFGLAREVGEADGMTKEGMIVGTPEYMSPEQARGELSAVGPRSDLYSLGVVLYRMLTGRLPFQGTLLQVLNRVANEVPLPPSRYRPDLDPRLEAIVVKAMSPRPEDRYANASALATSLEAWQPQSVRAELAPALLLPPLDPETPTELTLAPKPTRTWRRPMAAVLLGVAALIAGIIFMPQIIIRLRGPDGETEIKLPKHIQVEVEQDGKIVAKVAGKKGDSAQKGNPPVAKTESPKKKDDSPAKKPTKDDAITIIEAPDIDLAKPLLPGQPLSAMALVANPAPLAGVESWTVETREHRGKVTCLAFDPAATRLATGGEDGTVRIWDTKNGQLVNVLYAEDTVVDVAWASDGKRLAIRLGELAGLGRAGKLQIWDADLGRLKQTIGEKVVHFSWTPDGSAIACCKDTEKGAKSRHRLDLFDLDAGKTTHKFSQPVDITDARNISWSPDGTMLAVWPRLENSDFHIIDLRKNERLYSWKHRSTKASSTFLAWSPDSKRLAYADSELTVWSIANQRILGAWPKTGPVIWEDNDTVLVSVRQKAKDADNEGQYRITVSKGTMTKFGSTLQTSTGVWSIKPFLFAARGSPNNGYIQVTDFRAKPRFVIPYVNKEGGAEFNPSPKADYLAFKGLVGTSIVKGDTSEGYWLAENGGAPYAWSNDGTRILARAGDKGFSVMNVTSRNVTSVNSSSYRDEKWAFHPDGANMVGTHSLSKNKISYWNTVDQKTTERVMEDLEPKAVLNENDLALSSDGQRLAAFDGDTKKLRIWDTGTGKVVHDASSVFGDDRSPRISKITWLAPGHILAVILSMNNTTKISRVHLWDTGTAKKIAELELPGGVREIALSPRGDVLAYLRQQGASGAFVALPLGKNVGKVLAATSLPGDRFFHWIGSGTALLTHHKGTALVIDAKTGQHFSRMDVLHPWSADMWWIVTSAAGHYRIEGKPKAELIYVVRTDKGQEVLSPAAFAKRFGWKNDPAKVRLFPAVAKEPSVQLPTGPLTTVRLMTRDHASGVGHMDFGPNGRYFAIADGQHDLTRLYDLSDLTKPRLLNARYNHIAWSPHGKTVAMSGHGLKLFEIASGKAIRSTNLFQAGASAFSPSGDKLACAKHSQDPKRHFILLLDPQLLATDVVIPCDGHAATAMAWSPDGEFLVTAADNECRLWKVASKEQVWSLPLEKLQSPGNRPLVWSKNGSLIALKSATRSIGIIDVKTGKMAENLGRYPRHRTALTWIDDARTPTPKAKDGMIWITEPTPGNKLLVVEPAFADAAVTADGKLAAVAGAGKVRIQEITSMQPRLLKEFSIAGHEGKYIPAKAYKDHLAIIAPDARNEFKLVVWNIRTGGQLYSEDLLAKVAQDVQWSKDGMTLAVPTQLAGPMQLVNLASGKRGARLSEAEWAKARANFTTSVFDSTINAPEGSGPQRIRDRLIVLGPERWVYINADGHFVGSPGIESELVAVFETADGRIHSVPFSNLEKQFGWRNDPSKVQPWWSNAK